MNAQTHEHRNYGFAIGLLTGTVVGVGLALWLAPRAASEVRQRITDTARRVGKQATDQYHHASARVGEAVSELTQTGQDIRDDVADRVARGAHEVERYATAVKNDGV